MERIGHIPPAAASPDAKPATEVARPQSGGFLQNAARGEVGRGAADARRRALAAGKPGARGGVADADEALVVRFEPLQVRDGQLLVVAHVVSARLSDLFGKTQHSARRALRSPLPQTLVAQSAAEIELVASDGAHGRALIRVPRGELGPMTIELCLEQGRLQVRATVIDERAARALSDERALLAQSLALQGVELGEFSVVVEPRRPTRKTKPQAPASDTKGKEK